MYLHPDWKRILRKAWSVRLNLLAAFFGGLEVILPMIESSMPRGTFLVLSLALSCAAPIARVVAQPKMHRE